ncbi:hypothetical protein KIN20_004505 [Parelaphostrongylus tenuis]|uniref:Uncharacterized protein n=1 Tax=Parelaphostrongylus tenuis TaxID=148309 RepID=A0AAD5QF71_PARTN|nr:hypothetical protein KIN20_004505 [Parelaphostrongylus tenuis]
MDGLSDESLGDKSSLTSQSSIDDITQELDVIHEYSEEKQNSSKRKSPMDLTSQGKRYARSLSFSMDSDEEATSQAVIEDSHLIRPWVDQFQAMSRRCQRNALLHLISTSWSATCPPRTTAYRTTFPERFPGLSTHGDDQYSAYICEQTWGLHIWILGRSFIHELCDSTFFLRLFL